MIGTTVSHYKILDKLGEGGMGVVYKAQDTKLDRLVALKFLPAHVSVNEETKARFIQEAKAAAALNHANICTVYGVEEHDGQMFISMEYIEGGTLRQKLPYSKTDDALNIALQIGEAIQEAHSKGIVHRDIKADNIMLTAKGQAKVMDFGLAKLKGSLKLTRTSSTVGTLAYMAPEQIQGGEVDHRSDIFSFGVLLFEMLSGKTPFRGEHEAAMVYSIVNEEPESIQKHLPGASPELQYVFKTALEKNPEDRYQQISDVVRDLRRLRKQTSRVGKLATGYSPQQPSGYPPSTPAIHAPDVSQKRSRLSLYGGIGLAIVLIAAAVVFFIPKTEKVPFLKSKFTRMTSTGKARVAAISPDGRYISYSESGAGKTSLWVRQIATSSNIQIVPPQATGLGGLTFSTDGNFIYYTQSPEQSVISNLYRIPVLGGTPVRVISDVASTVSFSPDGKQITFIRIITSTGDFSIIVANADGSSERTIGAHKGETWFAGDPSWLPDGKTIAAGLGAWKGGIHISLKGVDVESGAERSLAEKNWANASFSIQWNSAGSGMFVRGNEGGSNRAQIYYVTYPSGEVHRITNDANHYSSSSTTADGKNLCVTQRDWNFKLHYIPNGNTDDARTITNQKDDGMSGLTIGGNGEIYYTSSHGGNDDIHTVKNDGSNQRQITSDTDLEGGISLTPDGNALLYSAFHAASTPSIFRINLDGSGRTQLTSNSEDYSPVMESAGKWIVISSWFRGPVTIMKIPAAGGERDDVSGIDGQLPFLSPDGRVVYFVHTDNQSPTVSLYSVSIDGGT
ncbi:MAG: serine/threonine protein kinase, partial [Bacteroidetes bacterium]|nr:serine/threonine protein kinase [Bacteroidota bacterium]